LLIALLVVGGVGLVGLAEGPDMTIGLGSFPSLGWTGFDEQGNLVRATGFNLGLGYSARYFYGEGGLRPEQFNPYWGWGTFVLIIPYLEFGWLYTLPMGGQDQYFAIDLGFIYILPRIGLGFYF